jgi:hypothetical protein
MLLPLESFAQRMNDSPSLRPRATANPKGEKKPTEVFRALTITGLHPRNETAQYHLPLSHPRERSFGEGGHRSFRSPALQEMRVYG